MGNADLPQKNEVKYLGMHLDSSLALVKPKSSEPNKSAIADSLQLQHRNPPALPNQDSRIHSECTLVHKIPQDQSSSTNEHGALSNTSEIIHN
jgi:hypothetical protein